ncbi:hypothetical protein HPB51_020777 [Rhipicephalus microplus]|uniref:Uncharacterized protein n=1 Tax=Rhipicephalus microplus TaxID=6941 RepID=A0A9J6DPK2_RHIMP|nr:hypothetical protein HPB51_020777 [Rhipicephalus microplus]
MCQSPLGGSPGGAKMPLGVPEYPWMKEKKTTRKQHQAFSGNAIGRDLGSKLEPPAGPATEFHRYTTAVDTRCSPVHCGVGFVIRHREANREAVRMWSSGFLPRRCGAFVDAERAFRFK